MEHKQLRALLPAELVDRVYAAAHADGVSISEWVTAQMETATKPRRTGKRSKKRTSADK